METSKDQNAGHGTLVTPPPAEHALLNGPGSNGHGDSERGTEAFADGQKAHPHGGHVHAHADVPTDLPKIGTWSVMLVGLIVIAAMVGLFFVGWIPRHHRIEETDKESASATESKPNVEVMQPKRAANALDIVLPASISANQETAVLPQANGYLKQFTVDIGDPVKKGELLAEIESPDVDAQLVQAKASVAQAQANLVKGQNDLDLAQTTLTRYEGFSKTGGVTQQQLDEKRSAFTQAKSDLAADQANVKVAEANVQRLTALQGFEKIYAPFDGVVTARNFDVGALMSATNPTPMFKIADTHVFRVYTNVPQPYVQSVRVGDEVAISVRNYPDRKFTGVVTRTAGALDPTSRTLRYEVDVPNKEGLLYAGMYGEAHITANQEKPPMVVPTSAVVFDSGGTKVWVVDQGKARVDKVDVGRDFGTEMEIVNGLKGDEQVVTNPGEKLADGVEVDVTTASQKDAPKQPQQASAR
ncbi:MAG TPA: efflux RND transporter periplasmic adaptor subunit [Tepidisphaeraceae bacterium]|jgi:RND family efflux transporter MFP subunit|nr:efflux RND transporter periplasmic adaptor subunit [Tepidisphaeraceae bacterium]